MMATIVRIISMPSMAPNMAVRNVAEKVPSGPARAVTTADDVRHSWQVFEKRLMASSRLKVPGLMIDAAPIITRNGLFSRIDCRYNGNHRKEKT
jgi:hypothetical protein